MRRSTLLITLLLIAAVAPAQFGRRFFRQGESQAQTPAAAPQAAAPQVPAPQAPASQESSESSSPSRSERNARQERSNSESRENRRSESSRNASGSRSRSSSEESASASSSNNSASKKGTAKKAEKPVRNNDDEDVAKHIELTREEKEQIAAQKELIRAADLATTVVADFLRYSQNGTYSRAAELLTADTQAYFASDLSAIYGNMKLVLDQITRGGDIRSVTYSSVSVRGEGAHVDAEISYRSGPTERRTFDLIKVKDSWRIALPVGPAAAALVQTTALTTASATSVQAGFLPVPGAAGATGLATEDSGSTATASEPLASPASRSQASSVLAGVLSGNLPRTVSAPSAPSDQSAAEALPISVSSSPTTATAAQSATTSALSDAPWGTR